MNRVLALAVCLALPLSALAQITPSKESLSGLYPGKTYSPYAERSFPDTVYWGDTHLHTALSADAGLPLARDEAIAALGEDGDPPFYPRTTCVACLVQQDQAWWIHLGDSRLYLLRNGTLVTRTRDHTPVEELLQSGAISADELRSHPLRNSVSRCLGGVRPLPEISFGAAELRADDTLLLCSDGLWNALPEQKLVAIPGYGNLQHSVDALSNEAELASYPHSDNISVVALRWLTATNPHKPRRAARPSGNAPQAEAKDPLQQAIDDIHRAMLDYAAEMKKS